MHQWFIELRGFNLIASLFDEERCQAIEGSIPFNPALDSQIVCISLDYLTTSPDRYAQVLDAGGSPGCVVPASNEPARQRPEMEARSRLPLFSSLLPLHWQLGPEVTSPSPCSPRRYNDLKLLSRKAGIIGKWPS